MFNFIFDPETNGIVLREAEKPLRREIRPVYCHELDMLGLKDRWRYPSDDSAPLMWAVNNIYFYKGRKVMKITGGSCHAAPDCCKCGAVVDYNVIGLNKRLIGRGTRRFMCLHCLAAFFGTTESAMQHKIDEFRDDGCPLFK